MRIMFIKHWIGEQDRLAVRRIIDEMRQRDNEKINVFMPKVVRMVRCIDPDKPEDELVELVKKKLKPQYQEKLALYIINTLEELNSKCLQIEAGMAAAAAASSNKDGGKTTVFVKITEILKTGETRTRKQVVSLV